MKKENKIEDGTVEVNGIHLYYRAIGAGKPLIIIHGGPGFDHNHMLSFKNLADEFRIIFYDQRATGNSSGNVDTNSITVDNFIKDLEALRKKLNLEKVNILGHSWGAVLGMFYGIQYSKNLDSLILLAPSGASTEFFDTYFKNIREQTSPADRSVMNEIEQSQAFKNQEIEAVKKYWEILLRVYFKDKSLADNFNLDMGKNTIKNQSMVNSLLMNGLGDFNIYNDLSSITCPTLIIHGTDDLLPYESSYKIHKFMPNSKLVILENSGHFMFIDSEDRLFNIIRIFLKDGQAVETSIPISIEEKLNI